MNRSLTNLALLITLGLVLTCCGQAPTGGAAGTAGSPAASGADKTLRVGIVQQTTHPALDAAREGAKKAFTDAGLKVDFIEKNAQNDTPTLTTIAEGFRDQKVDLVIAIGTQPVQAAYKVLKDTGIPIVFNSVTDPYQAGVAKSETEHPGLTGIQALPPVQQAFDLIQMLKPEAKKVGNIWTSSEKNSEVATGIAREYAKSKGIEFVEKQVTKTDEVLAAAEALAAEQVDAIFISTDSTVVSALESIVKVANESKIPLVCNDPASSQRGCVAALGLDYSDNGYQSAAIMAIPILKGQKKPDEIPILRQQNNIIAINTAAAQQQGVTIPDSLKSRARQTFEAITPKR
jgi:putative tryptophan/tyrosine transport system substrate-binding protein